MQLVANFLYEDFACFSSSTNRMTMKQAPKPAPLPTFDPTDGLKNVIQDEDRITELTDQSKDALLLHNKKKDLLKRVFRMQNDILEKAQLLDAAYGSDLHSQLKREIPLSMNKIVRGGPNNELAKAIVSLFEPLEFLHSYLIAQEVNADSRKLRNTARRQQGREQDTALAVAEAFVSLKAKIDNRVVHALQTDENPLSKWMLTKKLSDIQRAQNFDPTRVPKDKAHRRCLVCGNMTINDPIENDAVLAHNKQVDENYKKKLNVWNDYLKRKEEMKGKGEKQLAFPKDPTESNKVMRRAPTKGSYKIQILQCMASSYITMYYEKFRYL